MSSGSGLLLKAMSGSLALLQPGSVDVGAPNTIGGNVNARVPGHHLGPCWCPKAMLLPRVKVTLKSGLLKKILSGSVILPWPGSLLISVVHGGPRYYQGHMNTQGLEQNLWPYWYLRAMLSPEPCQSEWPAQPHGAMVLSWPGLLP